MSFVAALFLSPLVSLTNLALLAPMSTVAVALAGGFSLSVLGLAAVALTTHQVHGVGLGVAGVGWGGGGHKGDPRKQSPLPPSPAPTNTHMHTQISNTWHWVATLDMLGDSPSLAVINLLAVLPVITMSFVCHYNVLPIVSLGRVCVEWSGVVSRGLIACI
jgi:hypothetical protein